MKTGTVLGLLLTLPMMMGACESMPPVGGEPTDSVAPEIRPLPLEDVPEPRGFSRYRSENNNFSFVEGSYRKAELHYRGGAPSAEVADFYEGQMPIHGWVRIDREQVKGRRVLVYEKSVSNARYRTRLSIVEKTGWTDLEIRLDTIDKPSGASIGDEQEN